MEPWSQAEIPGILRQARLKLSSSSHQMSPACRYRVTVKFWLLQITWSAGSVWVQHTHFSLCASRTLKLFTPLTYRSNTVSLHVKGAFLPCSDAGPWSQMNKSFSLTLPGHTGMVSLCQPAQGLWQGRAVNIHLDVNIHPSLTGSSKCLWLEQGRVKYMCRKLNP